MKFMKFHKESMNSVFLYVSFNFWFFHVFSDELSLPSLQVLEMFVYQGAGYDYAGFQGRCGMVIFRLLMGYGYAEKT